MMIHAGLQTLHFNKRLNYRLLAGLREKLGPVRSHQEGRTARRQRKPLGYHESISLRKNPSEAAFHEYTKRNCVASGR
jgi:hypothetical protein